jgi:predicted O-methyltransferase YrrM
MSRRTIAMTDRIYEYLLEVSSRETPVMARLREETRRLGSHAGMQISPDQGQLMALLARLLGARAALEVGTFTGYSALAVASVLPQDGRLVACDVSAEWTAIGQRYWREAGVADRIDLRLGPALDTLAALRREGREGSFDMAFIDADKSSYARYYEHCLKLVRRGGVILIDNVLWGGSVADPAVHDADTDAIRALNLALKQDDRIDLAMLPVGDGLTMALVR